MLRPGQFGRLKLVLKLRRREAVMVRIAAVGASVLLLLGVGAFVLASATPGWWAAAVRGRGIAAEQARLATVLENALVTELSRIRPANPGDVPSAAPSPGTGTEVATRGDLSGGAAVPWAVRIRASEINAWLATKLPKWVEGSGGRAGGRGASAGGGGDGPWPRAVRAVRVSLADGRLTVGLLIAEPTEGGAAGASVGDSGAGGRVVWLGCEPAVRDGGLWLDSVQCGAGLLPVPLGVILKTRGGGALLGAGAELRPENTGTSADAANARDHAAEGAHGAPASAGPAAALRGERPFLQPATLKLGDGRSVRLLEVRIEPGDDAEPENGWLVVTCVTEGR